MLYRLRFPVATPRCLFSSFVCRSRIERLSASSSRKPRLFLTGQNPPQFSYLYWQVPDPFPLRAAHVLSLTESWAYWPQLFIRAGDVVGHVPPSPHHQWYRSGPCMLPLLIGSPLLHLCAFTPTRDVYTGIPTRSMNQRSREVGSLLAKGASWLVAQNGRKVTLCANHSCEAPRKARRFL